jgi:hypothetical protein
LRTSRRHRSARDAEHASVANSPAPLDRFAGRPGRARAFACRVPHAVAGLLAVVFLAYAPTARAGINETKSEMLWNIAKFVQWPDAALASSKGQIVFTILGEDDLAAELANLLSSKTINGKPVFVRFARRAQDARGSQILYVAASETEHLDAVLLEVSGSPVLTVADTPAFAAHGGMVGFASDSGKVRFEINLGHAERSGLRISAKLLALARVVDSGN